MTKIILILMSYVVFAGPTMAGTSSRRRPSPVDTARLAAEQQAAFAQSTNFQTLPDERWLLKHSGDDEGSKGSLVSWVPDLSRPVGRDKRPTSTRK